MAKTTSRAAAESVDQPLQKRPQDLPSKRIRWFFVSLAAVLILIVAVGFAPSFFLRNALNAQKAPQPLPLYLVFHGIVLTCWFSLFLAQPFLVAVKRTQFHKTLGRIGAVLAVIVFAISMFVVLRAPARDIAAGESVAAISLKVIGDIAILLLFGTFVVLAVVNRRKREIHMRMMAFSCIVLAGPAIARWPGAEENLPFSVVVPQLLLVLALIVHDLYARRRVHAATGWGLVSYLVALGGAVPLAFSPLGHRFIEALK